METIIKHKDLRRIRKKFANKKIVYCSGSFDLPHLAHILRLEYCKKLGDVLVVNIGPDKDIRRNKGKDRPILNERIRLRTIASMKPVDYCFLGKPFSNKGNPLTHLDEVLSKLSPDIYVLGEDSSDMDYYNKKAKEYGVKKVVVAKRNKVPGHAQFSTSSIVGIIKKLK